MLIGFGCPDSTSNLGFIFLLFSFSLSVQIYGILLIGDNLNVIHISHCYQSEQSYQAT